MPNPLIHKITTKVHAVLDTRSGELLSACMGIAIAMSIYLSPEAIANETLAYYGFLTQWVLISCACSFLCFVTTWIETNRFQSVARFTSGCVWGTMVLMYLVGGAMPPVFWCVLVLFGFDVIVVILKGKEWTRKKDSSVRGT